MLVWPSYNVRKFEQAHTHRPEVWEPGRRNHSHESHATLFFALAAKE